MGRDHSPRPRSSRPLPPRPPPSPHGSPWRRAVRAGAVPSPHPGGQASPRDCLGRSGRPTGLPRPWTGLRGRGASASWCSRCWAGPWTRPSSSPTGTGGRWPRGSCCTRVRARPSLSPPAPGPQPPDPPGGRLRLPLPPAADAYCLLEVYWALCREPACFRLAGDLARSPEPAGPQEASAPPPQVTGDGVPPSPVGAGVLVWVEARGQEGGALSSSDQRGAQSGGSFLEGVPAPPDTRPGCPRPPPGPGQPLCLCAP